MNGQEIKREWSVDNSDENRRRRPWAICRLGAATEKARVVNRFANRQDAEDSLRMLRRLMNLKDKANSYKHEEAEPLTPQFVLLHDHPDFDNLGGEPVVPFAGQVMS